MLSNLIYRPWLYECKEESVREEDDNSEVTLLHKRKSSDTLTDFVNPKTRKSN